MPGLIVVTKRLTISLQTWRSCNPVMPGLIVVTNERNKKECYWLGCNPVMPGLIVVTIGTRAIGTRAIGCNPVMPGLIVVTKLKDSHYGYLSVLQSRYAGTNCCNYKMSSLTFAEKQVAIPLCRD